VVETQNVQAADPRNYQVSGRVCLYTRARGSIVNADWRDLGNLTDLALANAIERLEHFSMRRGERLKDRTVITQRTAQLNVTLDEINRENLKYMFGASSQVAGTVILNFTKTVPNPGALGVIQLAPVMLEAIGTEVVAPVLQELPGTPFVGGGTDYTYDPAAGTITIVALGALDDPAVVPEVHLFYQKSVTTENFEIFDGAEIEVEGKLQVLSPNGIQYALVIPKAVIHANGDFTVGDGTVFQTMPVQLDLLDDGTGKLATMHVIKKADLIA
jgi:hypothetical protein